MNSARPTSSPCNGTIPADWEMPELDNRITRTEESCVIDFRGLSSPTPLVATLKALEILSEEMHFEGYYPKSPLHLFPHLVEDGWSWEVLSEDEDGTRLKIFKKECSS